MRTGWGRGGGVLTTQRLKKMALATIGRVSASPVAVIIAASVWGCSTLLACLFPRFFYAIVIQTVKVTLFWYFVSVLFSFLYRFCFYCAYSWPSLLPVGPTVDLLQQPPAVDQSSRGIALHRYLVRAYFCSEPAYFPVWFDFLFRVLVLNRTPSVHRCIWYLVRTICRAFMLNAGAISLKTTTKTIKNRFILIYLSLPLPE